jgi:ADP-L-glycero-D-manno-heptose 6-epimerase
MLLVTGGAGFIGSVINAALAQRGLEVAVCDWLGAEGKWRNLAHHPPAQLVAPESLPDFLASNPPIEAVIHLGAVTATTASDGDLVWKNNVALSQYLWAECAARGIRLIYASSAATYGDGAEGFEDDPSLDHLRRLRPLNLYGWSKHAFDLWVAGRVAAGSPRPPQWVGLKFFNVYGPNEYHKGSMVSAIKVKHDEVVAGARPRLFRSERPGIPDGAQQRDFLWVGDIVEVVGWLLANPEVNGLYNLGTGSARTYLDLAHAVCHAAGVAPAVEFVPLPEPLKAHYQYFTEATMGRLRQAGYSRPFTALEAGIETYVRRYLQSPDPYV